MTTLIKFIIVLIIGTTTIYAQQDLSDNLQDIHVTITDIDSDEGMLYIGLYNSEDTFLSKRYKGTRSNIKDGKVVVSFQDIPEGTYAVTVFHDENSNQKLDTNFMGIPKEDTGCSNNAKGFMSAPKWKDAKFILSDTTAIIEINM
ncbi:hypothetical protein GCM10011344_09830 [Dokdonia pacifica]|uniref:Uncharacterized conserved protein, DUF2141 family n=1 Tax=Dokdonia pacifica TaxID=1627892 RepID=A0A238YMV9_9FLAO|nr:DUF2141 domain-containing protein [Dokdonia pacifica]GGG11156.1 hypothetical protein GCM10011344_09830 [Dokdonia pacifica]SNR72477.1 Uncharacterized conserved protein, DUF2141 family [Dokdonia pacifica]